MALYFKLISFLNSRVNLKSHALQSLANYVQMGGSMVMGIILARLLLPEEFGRYAYVLAVISVLMIPFGLTVTPLLVTDGGRDPNLFKKVWGFMCITSGIKLFILSIFACYLIFYKQYSNAFLAVLIGAPIAIYDLPETLRSDLEGRGRFAPNLAVQMANLSTHGIVSIGLVLHGWGVFGLAMGGFAAYWPQLFVYLATGGRKLREATFKYSDLLSLMKPGFSFWTMQFSSNMSTRIDKIFLGQLGGDIQLGYYNRAFNYAPFSMFILSSLLTNATVVAIRQKLDMHDKLTIVRKTSLLLFFGAIVNWLLLWHFSDPLVPWVFGDQWREAAPAFQAFSWLGFATALQYIPMNFLLAHEAHFQLAIGKAIGLLFLALALVAVWLMKNASAVTVAYAFSGGMAAAGVSMCIMSISIIRKHSTHVPNGE
jgi:O-antigen/teichoic acid export membrane protein